MIRYVFASDKVVALKNLDKVDPQKIGEAIADIAARNDGRADPQSLWQEARGNPRHPCFLLYEWDVQRAAEQFWTHTSRKIIAAIRPLDDGGSEMEIPAFISVNTGGGAAYRAHTEIMESRELQARVLEQAERDLLAFQKRYRSFRDLFESLEVPIAVTRKLRETKRKPKEDRPGV